MVGSVLPAELAARLDDAELGRWVGHAVSLITVDAGGWPHAAMLGYGDVAVVDAGRVRFAVSPGSTTDANLGRAGKATFLFVAAGTAHYVKCSAARRRAPSGPASSEAVFEATVDTVLEDRPDPRLEGGVTLVDGITYSSANPDAELARARARRSRLRCAVAPDDGRSHRAMGDA